MDPHSSALVLERRRPPLRGRREQFLGYGITGIAFTSGHIVALRRFTASSIGPPYTTIWVRDPHGRWVFHTNVEPRRSCPRYFGPLLHAARVDDIEVTWIGSSELYLAARDARLRLAIRFTADLRTRVMSSLMRVAPEGIWHDDAMTRRMGAAGGRLLRVGAIRLAGRAPSGHRYHIRPTGVWRVESAAGVFGGRDIGDPVPLEHALTLGDMTIPRRSLFMTGTVSFDHVGVIDLPAATRAHRSRDTLLRGLVQREGGPGQRSGPRPIGA